MSTGCGKGMYELNYTDKHATCLILTLIYFFPNQNNSCSRIFSNKCAIAQVYIGMNIRIEKEYLAGALRKFARNIISNIVCKLA
jgi:hypothetical protein